MLIKKMSIPPIVLLVYRSTVYDHAADDFIVIVPSDHIRKATLSKTPKAVNADAHDNIQQLGFIFMPVLNRSQA